MAREDQPKHYTAIVEVTEVFESYQPTKNGYSEGSIVPKSASEVGRIVVRAKTLEDLKAKITAHTNLL